MVALSRATPEKIIDTLTTTADTIGSSYAIPSRIRIGSRGISWQTIIPGSASAVSVQLQVAMNDTSSEYAVIDTSSVAAGELRILPPEVNARFIRARQVSRTGGDSLTVQVLMN